MEDWVRGVTNGLLDLLEAHKQAVEAVKAQGDYVAALEVMFGQVCAQNI